MARISFLLGLMLLAGTAGPARADTTVLPCNALEGGEVIVEAKTMTMGGPCSVKLKSDLVLRGNGGAVLPLAPTSQKPYGIVFDLNGHTLTVKDLEFEFSQGYAIDVLGHDAGSLTIENVKIVDTGSSSECANAEKRFGLIAHRVASASITGLEVRGTGSNPANLQGGVLLVGSDEGSASPIVWSGGMASVRCGLAAGAIRRPLQLSSVSVQSIGPCDLRPKGFSTVVDTGRP